jgi:hypothetical protein
VSFLVLAVCAYAAELFVLDQGDISIDNEALVYCRGQCDPATQEYLPHQE